MAIWISSNIDIGRSLNSCDSFPGWKFKNPAPTSCSPGPILWPPTISFELHAEMAEEIDLEKCIFRNFGSSVTLTLTLDRVEVTLVRICGRGIPTHEIRWKSEQLFVDVRTDGRTDGRTDTPEFQSTRSSPRRWPKNLARVRMSRSRSPGTKKTKKCGILFGSRSLECGPPPVGKWAHAV